MSKNKRIMSEETNLSYTSNHVYREGYDQGRKDAIYELELHTMLQDVVYAQSMINRTVYRLNCISEQLKEQNNVR